MRRGEPAFTVGIEEEYLLVNRDTRDLVSEPPPSLMSDCEALLDVQVNAEFLRSQIEVSTRVCTNIQDARRDLVRLRATVAKVADRHAMAPMAASTHPFADWDMQKHTDKERYNLLARDLQAVARRLVICGMHVHVGIEDEELRIDLMNQVAYFLPHLLALSTSSPFWRGENTGLMSYRVSVWDEVPRTGLPERFASYGEYQRHVDVMIKAGLLEDATKIWWDVRPSARFPTLEMRIPDMCTHVDDAVTIAALFMCLLRMLYRLRCNNQRWRIYARMLVNENRWRAQRYGINEGLVDFGAGRIIPYDELLDEMLALIAEDAEHFGCTAEVAHARDILAHGTSAHRQIGVFERAVAGGASRQEALAEVVDMLIVETVHDL